MSAAMLAVVGVAGAALGVWVSVRTGLDASVARMVVAVGMFAAVLVEAAGLSPVPAAVLTGLSVGMIATVLWWSRRDEALQRAARFLPRDTQRIVVRHELAGALPWMAAPLAITAAAAGAAVRCPIGVGAVVVGLIVGAVAVTRSAPSTVQGAPPPADDRIVEAEDADDRARLTDLVASHIDGAVVLAHPTALFRGLVGWNLGLGLDAEHAAWAAQIAREQGLGGVLAEPESAIDEEQAAVVAMCRAVATPARGFIVELPAGLGSARLRRLAGIVAKHGGGRPMIVVTDDATVGRAFLARSH